DLYLPFSLTQLVVPGTSSYRPLSTALGIVAAELLLALAITNRYRKALSYRFWRRAHYLNFAVWGLALVHGIFAGTDRGAPWADFLYGCSAAAVAGFALWRARVGVRPPAAPPLPHAQGDPGRLEAGLLRGEEDPSPLRRSEREPRDAPNARLAGLSLDAGADDAHLHSLHPVSACVLDRDADGPAPPLAQAALAGRL